ncbi:MAG: helix-turn-helix domain-containing protein [Bacteroidota bacterium]
MMKTQYTVIKTKEQYYEYCRIVKEFVFQDNELYEDEIELLELLIEKWDQDHNTLDDLDPVELIKSLMEDHRLKAKDLAELLNLSKGTVSKILNYQKGLSKESIRKLSKHFKLYQEAFNRPYPLLHEASEGIRNAS